LSFIVVVWHKHSALSKGLVVIYLWQLENSICVVKPH